MYSFFIFLGNSSVQIWLNAQNEKQKIQSKKREYDHYTHAIKLEMLSSLKQINEYYNNIQKYTKTIGPQTEYIPIFFNKSSFLEKNNPKYYTLPKKLITFLHDISEAINKNNDFYYYFQDKKKHLNNATYEHRLSNDEHQSNIKTLIANLNNIINMLSSENKIQ